LCCSVYCLCVNVYCTTATGCQPNCSWCIYHIQYHIMPSYLYVSYDFQNKEWLLPHKSLTGWLCNEDRTFTVKKELNSYISFHLN
jgi:hypothetical protein